MDEQSERAKIAELKTEIVAAYVSNHKLHVLEVPILINVVGTELGLVGTEARPIVLERPELAGSVRRSIRPDHLVCLICAKKAEVAEAPPRGGARAHA